jgi:hypothetical protein
LGEEEGTMKRRNYEPVKSAAMDLEKEVWWYIRYQRAVNKPNRTPNNYKIIMHCLRAWQCVWKRHTRLDYRRGIILWGAYWADKGLTDCRSGGDLKRAAVKLSEEFDNYYYND